MGKFVGARPVSSGDGVVAPVAPEKSLLGRSPAIWEYLTQARWEDGKPRELSKVTAQVEDGVVKVALVDTALERSLWRSGETLEDALRALEKALAEDKADWRRWWKGKKK